MQSPKYSAFSAYNPPHPAGLKQTQPYPGHLPYNNPVTVQNPGTTYVPVQPLPKLILYCPCCKIPWETYGELASHCCGKSFDSFIHCGQPHCIKTFFKEDVNKYLDHVQKDHVQRHELGIPEPPPEKASPRSILIAVIIFIVIIIIFGGLFYGISGSSSSSTVSQTSYNRYTNHNGYVDTYQKNTHQDSSRQVKKVENVFANDKFFQDHEKKAKGVFANDPFFQDHEKKAKGVFANDPFFQNRG